MTKLQIIDELQSQIVKLGIDLTMSDCTKTATCNECKYMKFCIARNELMSVLSDLSLEYEQNF